MIGGKMRPSLPVGDTANVRGQSSAERALCKRAMELCGTFRRALDVHGHVGVRSSMFAEKFNKVEAFEPHGACHRCFLENVDSPRVTLRRLAVHSSNGTGYVPTETGKDSTTASVRLQSVKGSVRVPLAAIDSFAWPDVDLIFISASADWLDVIAGAAETIRRSRPVICIRPSERNERDTGILRGLAQLTTLGFRIENEREMHTLSGPAQLVALGYRVEEADDGSLILHAGTEPSAPSETPDAASLLLTPSSDEQYLIAAGPDPRRSTSAPTGHSMIGRTLFRTRSWGVDLTSGPTSFHELTLPAGFNSTGYRALTLPGGGRVRFEAVVGHSLPNLADRLELRLSAAGGTVTMPPLLAAIATHVVIDLIGEGGAALPVFSKAVRHLSPADQFSFSWPLVAMQAARRVASVQIFRGDAVIAERTQPVDFTLHHLDAETVNCYLNHGGGGNAAMEALANSLQCRKFYAEDGYQPGVSAVWGVLRGSKDVIDDAVRNGTIFYYVDHAYLGRGHQNHYRITRDAFEAGPVRDCPPDRFKSHDVDLRPWRENGTSIIVCPPTDYFKEAHGCHGWLDETLATLHRHTDRPIVIREKIAGEAMEPLPSALADAHALVTHSSNVAIEAAILGTPVFVSERSAARPVGLTDLSLIETPARPARKKWLAHLAYSQFSYDEMLSGEAWNLLREFERFSFLEDPSC